MRNVKRVQHTRKSLRRQRSTPPQAWPSTKRPWLRVVMFRVIVAVGVGCSSLWVVLFSMGKTGWVPSAGAITVQVSLDPVEKPSFLEKELIEKRLFLSAELFASVDSRPPLLGKVFPPTWWEVKTKVEPQARFELTLKVWKDKNCTIAANPLTARQGLLHINVYTFGSVGTHLTYLTAPGETPIEVSPLNELVGGAAFAGAVSPENDGPDWMPPLMAPTYKFFGTYPEKASAAIGLSQFRWSQNLTVEHASEVHMKLTSRFIVDPDFTNLQVLANDAVQGEAKIRREALATIVEKSIAPVDDQEMHADGESIEMKAVGSMPERKDFVDLLIFAMAATFGAAIATLVEALITTVLKLGWLGNVES